MFPEARRLLRAALGAVLLLAGAAVQAAAIVAPVDAAPPPVGTEDAHCPPPVAVPTQDDMRDGMRHAVDSGLLWKATRDGRSVYLYGTIHVARMAWMFPGRQVLKAVLASDVIRIEMKRDNQSVFGAIEQQVLECE